MEESLDDIKQVLCRCDEAQGTLARGGAGALRGGGGRHTDSRWLSQCGEPIGTRLLRALGKIIVEGKATCDTDLLGVSGDHSGPRFADAPAVFGWTSSREPSFSPALRQVSLVKLKRAVDSVPEIFRDLGGSRALAQLEDDEEGQLAPSLGSKMPSSISTSTPVPRQDKAPSTSSSTSSRRPPSCLGPMGT